VKIAKVRVEAVRQNGMVVVSRALAEPEVEVLQYQVQDARSR
jgi:hypothetical protein